MHLEIREAFLDGATAPGEERGPHADRKVAKPEVERSGLDLGSIHGPFRRDGATRDQRAEPLARQDTHSRLPSITGAHHKWLRASSQVAYRACREGCCRAEVSFG